MTITTPTGPTSKESTPSLAVPPYATASSSTHRRTTLFVPRDQAYYWTAKWQRDEAEAVREIADGKARRFNSGAAAAEWLLSDEEE